MRLENIEERIRNFTRNTKLPSYKQTELAEIASDLRVFIESNYPYPKFDKQTMKWVYK